jgi:hypothetical protein
LYIVIQLYCVSQVIGTYHRFRIHWQIQNKKSHTRSFLTSQSLLLEKWSVITSQLDYYESRNLQTNIGRVFEFFSSILVRWIALNGSYMRCLRLGFLQFRSIDSGVVTAGATQTILSRSVKMIVACSTVLMTNCMISIIFRD